MRTTGPAEEALFWTDVFVFFLVYVFMHLRGRVVMQDICCLGLALAAGYMVKRSQDEGQSED